MSLPNDEFVSLRCSIQRALLGRIVPSMRVVTAEVTPQTRAVRVFFERPPNTEELELLNEADTEMLADYPDNKISLTIITLPPPAMVPKDQGIWVYARYEPTS